MQEPQAIFGEDGNATETGFAHCYSYSGETLEFISEFDFWTLIGSGIPANSTMIPPPNVTSGRVATFRDGNWILEEDHRGETVYSTSDHSVILVTNIGAYPAGTTPLKPTTVYDLWDGTKWVTDDEAKKQGDIAEANRQKQSLIYEADSICRPWQTQLLLGIITDADKASLTAWMKYYQQVQQADTNKAPEIDWPQKPAMPA